MRNGRPKLIDFPSEFGGSGKAVSGIDRIQDGRIWLMGMGRPIALRMTGG
jgi:hypothetical protein